MHMVKTADANEVITVSHRVGFTEGGRLLIAMINMISVTETIDSVTWGLEALTEFGTFVGDRCTVALYYLVDPATYPASATEDMVVTASGAVDISVITADFTGVNQATPLLDFMADYIDTGTSASLTLTAGAAGDLAIGWVQADGSSSYAVPAAGMKYIGVSSNFNDELSAAYKPGSTSVTMEWTVDTSDISSTFAAAIINRI
jgi:hypothetical protein